MTLAAGGQGKVLESQAADYPSRETFQTAARGPDDFGGAFLYTSGTTGAVQGRNC